MTFVRRHWIWLIIAANLALTTTVALVRDGLWPLLIVALAAGGLVAVVAVVMGASGGLVAGHAKQTAAAIEKGNHPMKEVNR